MRLKEIIELASFKEFLLEQGFASVETALNGYGEVCTFKKPCTITTISLTAMQGRDGLFFIQNTTDFNYQGALNDILLKDLEKVYKDIKVLTEELKSELNSYVD